MSVLDVAAPVGVLGGVAALSLFDLYTDPSSGSNLDVSTLAAQDDVYGGTMNWIDKGGVTRILVFDVTLSEEHGGKVLLTSHPVEEGSDVTDSARKELTSLKLEVFVTNQPVRVKNDSVAKTGSIMMQKLDVPAYVAPLQPTPGSLIKHASDAIGSFVSNLVGATSKPMVLQYLGFDQEFDAIADTMKYLDQIQNEASICQVATTMKVYDNLMLEEWTLERGPDDGEGGRFTLDFRAIRIVQAKTATVAVSGNPRAAQAVDKGNQTTTPVEPKKKSQLLDLAGPPVAGASGSPFL